MTFEDTVENNIVIMSIHGDIVGGPKTTLFHEKIHEYLKKNKKKFIFDCKKATWINSIGLGMFISALTNIKNADGRLVLCNIEVIKSVFQMTRMITVFEHKDSQAEALATFEK